MKSNRGLAIISLVAICIIWGTTYLAIKIGVEHFPPFLFSAIRCLIAGLILMLYNGLALGKYPSFRSPYIIHQFIAGFLFYVLGSALLYKALQFVPSGLASLLEALIPMFVVILNGLFIRDQVITPPIWLGLGLGLAGIVLIFSDSLTALANTNYQMGIILTFISIVGFCAGTIYTKKVNAKGNIVTNLSVQMVLAGLVMLVVSLSLENVRSVTWSWDVIGAMVYLILIGSVLVYLAYFYAIENLPMHIVTIHAYINPVIALLLGWILLDEKLSEQIMLAFLVIALGIYLVTNASWSKVTVN